MRVSIGIRPELTPHDRRSVSNRFVIYGAFITVHNRFADYGATKPPVPHAAIWDSEWFGTTSASYMYVFTLDRVLSEAHIAP